MKLLEIKLIDYAAKNKRPWSQNRETSSQHRTPTTLTSPLGPHDPILIDAIPTPVHGVHRLKLHTERHGEITITFDDAENPDLLKISSSGRVTIVPLAVTSIGLYVDPLRPPGELTLVEEYDPRAEARAKREATKASRLVAGLAKRQAEQATLEPPRNNPWTTPTSPDELEVMSPEAMAEDASCGAEEETI